MANERPLYVDLDGTLIKSDLLIESLLLFVKANPLRAALVLWWMLHGKAYLKCRIAAEVHLDPVTLPYNEPFLAYLRAQAASGRKIVLATACDERLAHKVAQHLGMFSGVLASNGSCNMSGKIKLAAMRDASPAGFDYAGNAKVDLEIWPHAQSAILVNPERGVEAAARRLGLVAEVFDDRAAALVPYLKAIRPHQWIKNGLLLVPLITLQDWHSGGLLVAVLIGVVAFSLCASSVYLVNDLLDLQSDRAHPRKRLRPFACGSIPLRDGFVLAGFMLLLGSGVASLLPPHFLLVLGIYLAVTVAYSVYLKTYVLIDVVVLAGLYTLRIIAGAAAIGTLPSFWLLAFSMCVFLSLALVKRCSEIISLQRDGGEDAPGRDYHRGDLPYLASMGMASGYVAVLVLALFLNSPEVATRYASPKALWLLCPLVLYWISRLWLKTGRGAMHDDPIIFTLRDRGSRYVVVAAVLTVFFAARGVL